MPDTAIKTNQVIRHGDSREVLKKLTNGTVASLITDPPFGVNNQSNMAKTQEGKKYARKIANDESPEQALSVFEEVMEVALPKMREQSDIYVFTSWQVLEMWLLRTERLFGEAGYTRKGIGVWAKDGPGMGDLDSWGMGMEFILYYKRGGRPRSDDRRNFVFNTPQIRPAQLIHPHEKPIALLQALIKHSTSPGDIVVDPFGGSGSLARAARELNRNALCVEYDEINYNLAVKKLNDEASGFNFDEA